jgi:hypothetical protein
MSDRLSYRDSTHQMILPPYNNQAANRDLMQMIEEDENDEFCSPLKRRQQPKKIDFEKSKSPLKQEQFDQQSVRSEQHHSPTKGALQLPSSGNGGASPLNESADDNQLVLRAMRVETLCCQDEAEGASASQQDDKNSSF